MRWLVCFLFLCALLSLLGSFTFQRFFLFIQSSNSKKKYQSIEYTFSVKIRFEFPQMCSNNEGSKVFTVQNFFFDWFNDWSLYCGIKNVYHTHVIRIDMLVEQCVHQKENQTYAKTLLWKRSSFLLTFLWNSYLWWYEKREKKKQNFVFAQIEQFCTTAKSNFLLSFIYSNTHSVNSVHMFFFARYCDAKSIFLAWKNQTLRSQILKLFGLHEFWCVSKTDSVLFANV